MATDIEVNRSGTWEAIDYEGFRIETGTSITQVAPTAEVDTTIREEVQAGQDLRITIDGTVAFEGVTQSGGTKQQNSPKTIPVEHAGVRLMEETAIINESSPTDEDVLRAAVPAEFTLDFAPTPTSLSNDYEVYERAVKRVFRDMMDRTGNVWWIDPGGSTIHVQEPGGRGQWQSLNAQTDRFGVVSFDEGSVETVRNDVTVIGTGDVAVEGDADDSTSISEYGRRPGDSPYKLSYVTSVAEADAAAESLLQPDPLPSGEIIVGKNVGDVSQPLANYTVDLSSPPSGFDIDATGLAVTKQTIEQGRATLQVGQGADNGKVSFNRRTKSEGDVTEPGSVYPTDRIDDDAITTPKLVDTSVVESKLADLAVATEKLENNAVINGKLADLSVSETKIQDDSISTPKLVAEAVTAAKIEADTITAAQIAAGTITALEIGSREITANEIAAGTITAFEIASDTITANQIETLELDANEFSLNVPNSLGQLDFETFDVGPSGQVLITPTNDLILTLGTGSDPVQDLNCTDIQGSTVTPLGGDDSGLVGTSGGAWGEMHAYAFIDADSGSEISDGGDPLAGLADGHGPPEFCRPCDEDGEPVGTDISSLSKWLADVAREQQRRIESLEERLAALEDATGGNA